MFEPIHSKIMKQLSIQNLPDALNPAKETLKQVEVSDRRSSQSQSIETYSVKTSSLKPS
jgi:hypothetical protein